MAGGRRRQAANYVVEEEKRSSAKEGAEVVVLEEEDEYPLKAEVMKLRQRWELASVLNCLIVFEPVIGKFGKISAEEIEMGLINPNASLAQLHIALLKGIPPLSKNLDGSDAWVTVLCKKLATWWPWVAEGEIPLMEAKGEEISRYKELDPTKRLLLLKALCELRADQDDALAYINDAVKQGTEVSFFRKDKIGGNGSGTSYWYEGNTIVGHRLYKEVTVLESKAGVRGKERLNLPSLSFHWETLATNLEEFRKVVDELSSSKFMAEVAAAKTIETDAIPALEKLQKKEERALQKKQREDRRLNDLRNSYGAGTIRSCRSRRPVSYTFDEYDRVIHEAIKVTNNKKAAEEQRPESKRRRNGIDTHGASEGDTNSEDNSGKKSDSMDSDTTDSGKKDDAAGSDTTSDMIQEVPSDDDDDSNWDGTKDEDKGDHSEPGNHETDKNPAQSDDTARKKLTSVRWSTRLANHPVLENRNLGTKNRSRQRPICNSALDSVVIQDSDDEFSLGKSNGETAGHEESPVQISQS